MTTPTPPPSITLIQDSHEQNGYGPLFQTPHVVGTLTYGDYSVAGLEHLISIERKSFQDLLNSVTNGRDRFETELKRARSLHRFFILVECTPDALLVQDFGRLSRANPRSVWGTLSIGRHAIIPYFLAAPPKRLPGCARRYSLLTKEFLKGTDALTRASRKVSC